MRHLILLILALPVAMPAAVANPTAGRVVVTEPLEMTALSRERRLRIYLPPGYDTGDTRYPVLYMHDAQNLFDHETAYAGEWQVDETLDALARAGGPELIVVGIDNGAELRLNEMAPWPHQEYGEPEAASYLDFIVSDVKPRIDRDYRTLPDRTNTGILGSSMGGLVSFFAAFEHSDVFSQVGLFSPSFWWSECAFELADAAGSGGETRFFLVVGAEEGDAMVTGTRRMAEALTAAGFDDVSAYVVPEAGHNEALWRSQMAAALLWLFADEAPD